MNPSPRLNIAPPQDNDGAIVNTKIAGKPIIQHYNGNVMLRVVVTANLLWLIESKDSADVFNKMTAIYLAMKRSGYNFFDRPNSTDFETASIGTALRAICIEKNFLLESSKDDVTLTLEVDLQHLMAKLPQQFLEEFANEMRDTYSKQLHSSHKTPPSLFQLDDNGKFFFI